MLIIGAGGFAKELVEVVLELFPDSIPVCFDNVNDPVNPFLEQFSVIRSIKEAQSHFKDVDPHFCLGLGGPLNRLRLFDELSKIGGIPTSIISKQSKIGKLDVKIGEGATILHHTTIANGSLLGKGCLLYHDVRITHDCKIGDFTEIAPGATLLGGVSIGKLTQIGANCTILPKVKIGEGCILGAGSVITIDIPDYSVVIGIPGKVVRKTIGNL